MLFTFVTILNLALIKGLRSVGGSAGIFLRLDENSVFQVSVDRNSKIISLEFYMQHTQQNVKISCQHPSYSVSLNLDSKFINESL